MESQFPLHILSLELGVGIVSAIVAVTWQIILSVAVHFLIPYNMCVDRELTDEEKDDEEDITLQLERSHL